MTSGIYAFENILDGRTYIGSSNNVERRKSQHLHSLRKGEHHSIFFQRAWNKDGEESFRFIILEVCSNDKKELVKKEQSWLDSLKPEYNLAPIAGNNSGIKHSEQSKKNMSEAHLGQKSWNKGNKGYGKGHTLSEEAREKIRKAHLGKKYGLGHKLSEDAKARIGAAHKGMKHSEEAKAKMRAANKGRKCSEETKAILRVVHKGNKYALGNRLSNETKAKIRSARLGKKASKESRVNMSIAQKAFHAAERENNNRQQLCMLDELWDCT